MAVASEEPETEANIAHEPIETMVKPPQNPPKILFAEENKFFAIPELEANILILFCSWGYIFPLSLLLPFV